MESKITNQNYLTANKIRMKLLILIDTEIHNQKDKFLLKNQEQDQLCINFEEAYSQEEAENYIIFNEKSNPLIIEMKQFPKKSAPLKSFIYYYNNLQSEKIKNKKRNYSSNSFQALNTTISYNNKKYSVKRDTKLSSTMIIHHKLKTDSKFFLKNLCENLKIIPQKQKTRNSSKQAVKKNYNCINYKPVGKINSNKINAKRRSSFASSFSDKKSDKIPIKPKQRKSLFVIESDKKLKFFNNDILKKESKLSKKIVKHGIKITDEFN